MALNTHLLCVPAELGSLPVYQWRVAPGEAVAVDQPIVELWLDQHPWPVCAHIAGVLLEQCVTVGEQVRGGELLGLLEALEPEPGHLLIEAVDGEANLALPACKLSPPSLVLGNDGLQLCAELGINPAQVGSPLSRERVLAYAREQLGLLAAIQTLLQR